jgi:methylmalonyl-CoA epimerase
MLSKEKMMTTSGVKTIRGEKWRLNHIGHAVESIDSAVDKYQLLYGFELLETENIETQKVEAAFLGLANCEIELIAPLPGNTTLRRFLDKRGEGLHHICFEVEDIDNELKRLAEMGVRLIDYKPRPGSRNTLIAFIHPDESNSVLVELCMRR